MILLWRFVNIVWW